MLEAVGIDKAEEEIYRALLANPTATTTQLADHIDTTTEQVSTAMQRLQKLGLVRTTGPDTYRPTDPDPAINALVHQRRAELDAAQATRHELAEQFHTGHLQAHPSHLIEVVTGTPAIAQRARELFTATTADMMAFDQPPYAAPLFDEIAAETPVLEKGIRIRVIYSQDALDIPHRLATINTLTGLGEEARYLPQLPIKLRIFDNTAIVPLTTDHHATLSVAIIHPSGLLDTLIALFETYWQQAQPIGQPPHQPRTTLTEQENLILTMLDAGLTDEAIAHHLDISMRTLGRRLHKLLTTLGATTRFQAGRQAAQQGWLPPNLSHPGRFYNGSTPRSGRVSGSLWVGGDRL